MKKNKATDKYLAADKIIRNCLLCIWALLMLFGMFTLIRPGWLENLSKPGRTEEAQSVIDEANAVMYQAHEKRDKELFEKAASLYATALIIDPGNLYAGGNLAIANMFAGHTAEAITQFKNMIKTDTIFKHIHYSNLGQLYEMQGDYQTALTWYYKALEKHDYLTNELRKAGFCHLKLKQYKEAIYILEKAVRAERDMGNLYLMALQDELFHAVNDDDQEKVSEITGILKSRYTSDKMKIFDQRLFNESLKKNKQLGYTYRYLGDVYLESGDSIRAEIHYRLAAEAHPSFSSLLMKQ